MPGSIVPLPVMLEEEDQKIYDQLKPPTSMVVRYGYQKLVAELPYDGDAKPGCGSKLVVRTNRGVELAEMLTTTCPNSGCGKSVSRAQMLDYIEQSGGKQYPFSTEGQVLRVATVEDMNQQAALDGTRPEKVKVFKNLAVQHELEMKLVDVEQLLDGERVVFYYLADDRVDFRELVKDLAAELSARIEMVQVNDREEARITADYEKCGQHCCCKNFLKVLKPVSMRSAKVQKATLDPQKISGRCGRLMCCLRYEDETYESLRKKLPHKKTRVLTDDGEGIVLNTQILTQLVLVLLDSGGKPSAYPLENIEILPTPKPGKKKKDGDKPDGGEGRTGDKPARKPRDGDRSDRGDKDGRERAPRGERQDDRGGKPRGKRSDRGDRGERSERSNDRGDRQQPTAAQAGNDVQGPAQHAPASGNHDHAGEGDGQNPGPKRKRSRRRRPKPGQPLKGHEVESKEGGRSDQLPQAGGNQERGSQDRSGQERGGQGERKKPRRPQNRAADGNQAGNAGSGRDGSGREGQADASSDKPPHPKHHPSAAAGGGDDSGLVKKKRRRRRRRRPSSGGSDGAPGGGGNQGGGGGGSDS